VNSRREALAIATYAIVVAAVLLLDPPALLAGLLGAPLVLLAPGLALVLALDIDGDGELPMRRLILAVGLSLAVTALGGIVINTFAPLDRTSWTIWFVGFTLFWCAIAGWRAEDPAAAPFASAAEWLPEEARGRGGLRWAAIAVVVGLILAGAATLTQITSRNAYDSPLVELSAQSVPGSNGAKVKLSVANQTGHAEALRLTISGGGPGKVEDLEVPASQSWSTEAEVGPGGLSAVLTKAGGSRPVGEVLWSAAGSGA
jgi:hypothetical protein